MPASETISFCHLVQKSTESIEDDDIRQFCALTPYKYSAQICRATRTNPRDFEWLKIMYENKMVGIAMLEFENGWEHVILQHILIQPEHRKKGIGTKTINYIKSRAEQVTLIATTLKNIEFYRTRGFKRIMEMWQVIQIMGLVLPSLGPPNISFAKNICAPLMSTTNMSVTQGFMLYKKFGT